MPSEHHEVVAAKYNFAGNIVTLAGTFLTLIGTLATAGVGLYTAGKKVNEATGQSVTVISNFQAGLTLARPSKSLTDSLLEYTARRSDPAPNPIPKPTPDPKPTPQTAAGTCSGLDPKIWSVQVAPVATLKGKDQNNQSIPGYNINLRLGNLSDQVLYVRYVSAELTDSSGSTPALTSASLSNESGSGIAVSPGSFTPVNLKFSGSDVSSAASVSFSVNLRIFTINGKPDINRVETFACTSMPV